MCIRDSCGTAAAAVTRRALDGPVRRIARDRPSGHTVASRAAVCIACRLIHCRKGSRAACNGRCAGVARSRAGQRAIRTVFHCAGSTIARERVGADATVCNI